MFDDRKIGARAALMSTITLLVALPGCRGNTVSPVAPSTTSAALTAPFQVELWTLTITPISVAGAACGVDTSIGSGGTEPMMVATTPQTVDFKPGDPRYWEPFDYSEYSGSRTGASFIARQTYPWWYTTPCGPVTLETTVIGTFSDDGSHLTAQQVDTFNVGDAHAVRSYSWSGDRQCDGSTPNCLIPSSKVNDKRATDFGHRPLARARTLDPTRTNITHTYFFMTGEYSRAAGESSGHRADGGAWLD